MADDTHIDASTLDRLFAVAPEEFVATRAGVVKELKAGGDKATAALVGKLRRPTVPDWLLNVVAREHADETAAFVDAADRLRQAQTQAIEGKGDPDLRGALQALRQQTGDLLGLANDVLVRAGKASGSQAGPLATRLAEIATTPASTALLRAGLLGSEDVAADDLFADLTPAASRAKRPVAEPEPAKAKGRAAKADDEAAAAETQAQEKAAAAAKAKALAAAKKEQAKAAARLAKAEERVEGAAGSVADAEERLAAARQRLEAAEADRDEAAADLERADADLADAS